jgi:hypothetical protein
MTIYTVLLPFLAVAAFAQDTQPKQPNQGTAQWPGKTSEKASDRPQEIKTQRYSGILMDASCAGSGAAPAASSAGPGGSQSCTVSAHTTEFAMKMKDGTTVRFDDVGNERVQEAMKTRKKWSESASANKSIQVKASGILNGDRLTVLSID